MMSQNRHGHCGGQPPRWLYDPTSWCSHPWVWAEPRDAVSVNRLWQEWGDVISKARLHTDWFPSCLPACSWLACTEGNQLPCCELPSRAVHLAGTEQGPSQEPEKNCVHQPCRPWETDWLGWKQILPQSSLCRSLQPQPTSVSTLN